MTRSKRPRLRLRLRHKLAASLSVAALLPVLVIWWVAGRVVLDNLDRGIQDDTQRQLQVGLSLVLRTVQRISADAAQVASSSDLAKAMVLPVAESMRTPTGRQLGASEADDARASDAASDAGESQRLDAPESAKARRSAEVRRFLDRVNPYLPSSLVQLFDADGQPVEETIVGNVRERFAGLRVGPDSGPVRAALVAKERMTIESVAGRLVVRAAAPILDDSFRVYGAVVISVPLDRSFAGSVKGALGTDVLIFTGTGATPGMAASTFLDDMGQPKDDIALAPDIARRVSAGELVLETGDISGRSYMLGYTPLINLDGEPVGIFAVAVDRASLATAQHVANRSLVFGAVGAVICALVLSYFLSRRLTGPLWRLHRGARAVARGDLEHRIVVAEGDEIGDLAAAFKNMTEGLKENRERLAARMDELVALHDAARAVSSVIDLEEVLRRIVDSVARVLDVRLCALWVVEEPKAPQPEVSDGAPAGPGPDAGPDSDSIDSNSAAATRPPRIELRLGAARAKPLDTRATMHGDEGAEVAQPLRSIAREVARSRMALKLDDVADQTFTQRSAAAAGVTGSLLATPLLHAGQVVGVIVVGRTRDTTPFSDADQDLLSTFADQAASAVANARLYQEVRAFNEELEHNVRVRTAELTQANAELEKTLRELRETQAQLISSERMAGLGLLVASVAHEINSPSAAIAGSVDALDANIARLVEYSHELSALALDPESERRVLGFVTQVALDLAAQHMGSGVAVRRAARVLRTRLQDRGMDPEVAKLAAARLAELGADEAVVTGFLDAAASGPAKDMSVRARVIANYLTEHVFLHKNALTIKNAIRRVQHIVGALKRYSHLDQEASVGHADVHEGIEDTLVILEYVLRDITLVRRYGVVPRIPVYVDELNQVWTNLIQNAVQALHGEPGGQVTIETSVQHDGVAVCIIDNGPGISEHALPRIFEPFFTTKPKGEGTGLGLGIVRQIVVDKHHGEVTCESRAKHTVFRVWLPMKQGHVPAVAEVRA